MGWVLARGRGGTERWAGSLQLGEAEAWAWAQKCVVWGGQRDGLCLCRGEKQRDGLGFCCGEKQRVGWITADIS